MEQKNQDPRVIFCQFSDEFLRLRASCEADELFSIARDYKSQDLKKVNSSALIRGMKFLEEKSQVLAGLAADYAFNNHEYSLPDYEKAIVYGRSALDEIKNALDYLKRGFE